MHGRTGYQHMVVDYYIDRFRELREQRRQRLRAVRTLAQARKYQEQVRRALRRCIDPRPRRTPLNARITGSITRAHHIIEKVSFESRPGCLVTAHLYRPRDLREPAPAVLGCCGHSDYGKLEPLYQEFCQRLVRAGFVVLIYDPFCQGERDQYWFLKDRTPVLYSMYGHNMMGKQLDLVGEWFGAWRAWDGVRALDYLLARPEVDSCHVGLTGNSGRRRHDHLAMGDGWTLHHGGIQLCCLHLFDEPRKRVAAGLRGVLSWADRCGTGDSRYLHCPALPSRLS